MGSKQRYTPHIIPILQQCINEHNIGVYVEPFVGGANVIDKIECKERYAYDRSDTLIALLKQMENNFDDVLKDGNRELWDKGKGYVKDGIMPDDMTLADIGAMEFFASYCNGGFPRGYAKNTATRNYYNEAYCNAKAQAPNLRGIKFGCQNYWELADFANAVIYLDPPYAGTKIYGYANQPKMDYKHFWQWVRDISKDNYVFTSEQTAPDDFEIIWEQEVKRTTNKTNDFKAVEKLFVWKDGLK